MTTNAISEETYNALVAAFRGAPGRHSAVARAVGVSVSTATRYWHEVVGERRPIREIVDAGRDIARAQLERDRLVAEAQIKAAQALVRAEGKPLMKEIAREALNDRERTAIDEGRMSRAARSNVILHLEHTGELLEAAADMRDTLARRMRADAEKQPLDVLARTIQAIGHMAKQAVEAAKTAAELERLILGEPTSRVAISFESPAMATREIAEAMAAARAAGYIMADGTVVDAITVDP